MAVLHEAQTETPAGSRALQDNARLRSGAASQALALVEGVLIVILGVACGSIYNLAYFGDAGNLDRYLGFGIAAAILFAISAHARGLYLKPQPLQLKQIVLIWTMVFLSLAVAALALGLGNAPAPASMFLFFLSGLAGIAVIRGGGQRALDSIVRKTIAKGDVIVLAQSGHRTPSGLAQIVESYGGSMCKTILLPSAADDTAFSACMAEAIDYARRRPVEQIVLATSWSDARMIEQITGRLRVLPLPVTLVADPVVRPMLDRPLVVVGPTRAVELQRAPLTRPQLAAKRILDLVVTVPAITLLLPILLAIAALIAIDSPGPVLFRQRRTGFNGRVFRIYKFRTMKVLDDGATIAQAGRDDDRVTRIGRLLRRFSLDELPQLLNVLKGEMSLVGPRPHALAHDDQYTRLIALYPARQKVKPGITGWAQVNGWRGGTPQVQMMIKRVEHDLWYVDHWSLWLDIKILILTGIGICAARNAY